MALWGSGVRTPSAPPSLSFTFTGNVLICHGARIVLNPQWLDWSKMLRVGTTRAPAFNLKFKLRHCPFTRQLDKNDFLF